MLGPASSSLGTVNATAVTAALSITKTLFSSNTKLRIINALTSNVRVCMHACVCYIIIASFDVCVYSVWMALVQWNSIFVEVIHFVTISMFKDITI